MHFVREIFLSEITQVWHATERAEAKVTVEVPNEDIEMMEFDVFLRKLHHKEAPGEERIPAEVTEVEYRNLL